MSLEQGYYSIPWIHEDFLKTSLSFVVDHLSLKMAIMAEIIGLCIKLYSFYYFKNNHFFLNHKNRKNDTNIGLSQWIIFFSHFFIIL